MDFDPRRYVRQILLPEIGEEGQRELRKATAHVAGAGLKHEVADRYARGAGFLEVQPGPIDEAKYAPRSIVTVPAARALLAGSRAVLREMRLAIGKEKA